MNQQRLLLLVICIFCGYVVNAQIFINTGNPNLDKYKNSNPNAVIWQGGKNVPVPPNTPEEPKEQPKKTTKEEAPAANQETKVVEEKKLPVKEVTPVKATTEPAPASDMQYPPNAIPGKCYARCIAPDQVEIKEEQVIDKPASFKIERIPARYETVYDTVVIKPAYKKNVITPAVYETITEDKLITPGSQKWVKGKADKNCLSSNPKDCEVWCLKEVPAVYEKVTRKVEKVAAVSNEIEVPAVTKVLPRKKLVEAARENKIEIPATYKTVMTKVVTAKGGYQEWKEVMCEQNVTDNKVAEIQSALKREGYDPGPIDNQMGGKTKEALIKFQQDKGLPVGNLNLETLKSLGVQH